MYRSVAKPLTRREFVKGLALVSGGGAAASLGRRGISRRPREAAGAPSIVVVGAGLAGLTAAYRIHQAGYAVTIYEAQERVGGRVKTIRTLADGQYTEGGASGISTPEAAIQDLCKELGLWPLEENYAHYPQGSALYRFNGKTTRSQPYHSIVDELAWKHFKQLEWPVTYRNVDSKRNAHWDRMTVAEWIDRYCPGGLSGRAGAYLAGSFAADYGGAADMASAIQLIADIAGGFWPSGSGNERYAVPGGNDALPTTIASRLPEGTLVLDHALVAVRGSNSGAILVFETGGSTVEISADRVVLATPFSTLKDVDLSESGFGLRKLRSIDRLGIGKNAKLNLQFNGRPWAASGGDGDSDSDLITGETWQSSWQAKDPAILIMLTSHDFGDLPAHDNAPGDVLKKVLKATDILWPGTSDEVIDGQSYLDNWPNDPWARGSYAYYKPGGFTSFAGIEKEPEGNVYFAGEHTARYVARGYMNGAVESGERAAQEVLASL